MSEQNQNLKVYDFNSVGESLEAYRENRRLGDTKRVPVGIATPMQMAGPDGGLFEMHYDLFGQVRDNFKNLILTNHGERLGQYDFGANLQELTMELGSESFDNEAIKRIKLAVSKYMPYINLHTFEPSVINDDQKPGGIATVGLKITYSIPAAKSGTQAMEVVLYTAG